MSEKIGGYILLLSGLLIILFSAFNVYQVFKGKTKPVSLFHFDSISIDLGSLIQAPDNATAEQQMMVSQARSKVKPSELISANMLNETSNIAAHMFLMGFIANMGYRVGSLGIQLLRPIHVKLRETEDVKH